MTNYDLPRTVYAVALLYGLPDGRRLLTSRIFHVSGINPLTSDEAVARARKSHEDDWDEKREGFVFSSMALTQAVASSVNLS